MVRTKPHTFIRPKAVAGRFGICAALLYRWASSGLMPPPIKLGPRASAWPDAEIDAIAAARISGASTDEIRALVLELVAARRLPLASAPAPEPAPARRAALRGV